MTINFRANAMAENVIDRTGKRCPAPGMGKSLPEANIGDVIMIIERFPVVTYMSNARESKITRSSEVI